MEGSRRKRRRHPRREIQPRRLLSRHLSEKIGPRTRLVAAGYATNATGTINNVAQVVQLARQAGALSYIDAVHYAPHGPIDVRALDCDFLACSTYKFFGPHMGVLYGKREHLKRLTPYKLRPNADYIPNCWEWGTLNHECIAGIKACVDYWEELGRRAEAGLAAPQPQVTRRSAILAAHQAIHLYERKMTETMIAGLLAIPGLKLYGITDPQRFDVRREVKSHLAFGWGPHLCIGLNLVKAQGKITIEEFERRFGDTAELVGGRLEVLSSPERGTTVIAKVPSG